MDKKSSSEGLLEGPEADNLGVFYVAKCGNHPQTKRRASAAALALPRQGCNGQSQNKKSNSSDSDSITARCPSNNSCFVPASDIDNLQSRLCPSEEEQEEEEEEILGLQSLHPSNLKCTCFDPDCKLRSYFKSRTKYYESKGAAVSTDNVVGGGNSSYLYSSSSLPFDPLSSADGVLAWAYDNLMTSCGDPGKAKTIYECCRSLHQRQPEILSTNASDAGDTVLMQLCARRPETSSDPNAESLLNGQIAAFIRIFSEHCPELLFVRNRQGSNALELASVTNKLATSVYLAILYAKHGRDVNETNPAGHSVMHIMARKGDDCAETLEVLLRLRNNSAQRLLRYDIVNDGGKTPLDVAVACSEIFSTGKNRTIYNKVIKLFLDAVEEDAKHFEEECNAAAVADATKNKETTGAEKVSESRLTFRNF